MSQHTITVEFDQSMHPNTEFDKLDEPSKVAFAALDTAYKLLREYAVRVVLTSIREEAKEQGQELPSDEELFRLARESGVEGAPTSYLELAPDVEIAALGLHGAFQMLVEVATVEAEEGLGLAEQELGIGE